MPQVGLEVAGVVLAGVAVSGRRIAGQRVGQDGHLDGDRRAPPVGDISCGGREAAGVGGIDRLPASDHLVALGLVPGVVLVGDVLDASGPPAPANLLDLPGETGLQVDTVGSAPLRAG